MMTVSTRGGTTSITLLGAAKTLVKLGPGVENRFDDKGSFEVASRTKVLATVTLAGKT